MNTAEGNCELEALARYGIAEGQNLHPSLRYPGADLNHEVGPERCHLTGRIDRRGVDGAFIAIARQ